MAGGGVRADTPLRINIVAIEGTKRTQNFVIEDELQEAYAARTVAGVHQGLVRAVQRLERLGVFKGVNILMKQTPDKRPNLTDLLVTVEEASVISAYTGATMSRDDVGLDASCKLRNPTGHGESIQGSLTRTQGGNQGARLTLSKPRIRGASVSLNADLREDATNMERTSSVHEVVRGLNVHLMTHDQRHRLSYELAHRDLLPRRHPTAPYACDASLTMVMKEARPSLKSSVRYRFSDDRRDHPAMPTQGTYFSMSTEVAGVGFGDATFVKGELSAGVYSTLAQVLTTGLRGSIGVVHPLTSWWDEDGGGEVVTPVTHFSDRFFMGGMASGLRGFAISGVGPRASPREGGCIKGDALGGDLKFNLSASASVPVPLPLVSAIGLRLHAFADVGNLQPWSTPLSTMISGVRVAVGAGLAANLQAARLELNYAIPVRKSGADIEQRVQFGIATGLEL